MTIHAACNASIAQTALPEKCTKSPTGKPTLETLAETKTEQTAVVDNVTTTVTEDTGATDGGKKTGRAHGVLRLLEAGHFKAQPEYRLRLHFGDLLRAWAPEPEEEPAVEDGVGEPAVVDGVGDEVVPPTQPPTTGDLEPLDGTIGVSLSLLDLFA